VHALVGGTDLIDQIKQGRRTPEIVMDVKRIPEMMRLEWIADEGLHIGAAVPCTDTAAHPSVHEKYPSIEESCLLVGSVQIQNRASIGGNVSNSAPSADTVPALLTYSAKAIITGPRGTREILIEDFFTGPGQNVLHPDEILLETLVMPPPPNSSGHYMRFIPRNEMDIAVAGVASMLALEPGTRKCKTARIALASVAPTPVRAKAAETILEGHDITPELIEQAGELAIEACSPIDDVRGTVEYRKELVKVLTRRTITQCMTSLGHKL
jgi:CO/xanthine dehydrogenase FAD-binding subunit